MKPTFSYIKWLNDVGREDFLLVGGKAASQGEMIAHGIPVPRGFCITAEGFAAYLDSLKAAKDIKDLLSTKTKKVEELILAASKVGKAIKQSEMTRQLMGETHLAINSLRTGNRLFVVRSSATVEDTAKASFAGQFASFIAIKGVQDVVSRIKDCWASVFSERVVLYAVKNGISLGTILMAVIVQEFVNAKKAGVLFTIHPLARDNRQCLIEASWGLGETVVSGEVSPDRYIVDKQTMSVLSQEISDKDKMRAFGKNSRGIHIVDTPPDIRQQACLAEEEVLKLTELGERIERIFGYPQDIEWAIEDKQIFILQSRPITTIGNRRG